MIVMAMIITPAVGPSCKDIQVADKVRIDFTKLWTIHDSTPKELVHIPISEILPTFEKLISK